MAWLRLRWCYMLFSILVDVSETDVSIAHFRPQPTQFKNGQVNCVLCSLYIMNMCHCHCHCHFGIPYFWTLFVLITLIAFLVCAGSNTHTNVQWLACKIIQWKLWSLTAMAVSDHFQIFRATKHQWPHIMSSLIHIATIDNSFSASGFWQYIFSHVTFDLLPGSGVCCRCVETIMFSAEQAKPPRWKAFN